MTLTLTFQGRSRSKLIVSLASPYGFLLLDNSNKRPISAHLWTIRLWNPSDLDFDLSRSLNVQSDDVIRLAIYGFLLMVNGSIGPSAAPLRDTRAWNLSDLDFDLSSSLKVQSDNVIRLAIYGFLLKVGGKIGPNSAPLQDIRLSNLNDWLWPFKVSRSKVMMAIDSTYRVSY